MQASLRSPLLQALQFPNALLSKATRPSQVVPRRVANLLQPLPPHKPVLSALEAVPRQFVHILHRLLLRRPPTPASLTLYFAPFSPALMQPHYRLRQPSSAFDLQHMATPEPLPSPARISTPRSSRRLHWKVALLLGTRASMHPSLAHSSIRSSHPAAASSY